MNKTAILYWSGTGNTQAMANAVAAGASAAGAEVSLIAAADFDTSSIEQYSGVALGCPSMGVEELEDSEFLPMFEAIKTALPGKKVVLFGSYGWGDGEWMRTWEADCASCGITLAYGSVICNDAPDDDAIARCEALGKAIV